MSYGQDEREDVIDSTQKQLKSAEQLPPDLMLLKMENESIMAVARAKPRDNVTIVKQLQSLVDAYPASADDAIYKKPVGTAIRCICGDCGATYEVSKVYDHGDYATVCDKCESPKRKSQQKVKKFAEGLSVRAAESIRSIYGFTRLETRCEIDDEGKAKLTGIFVDYAAGNVTMDSRIVTPYYKQRNGGMTRTPEDRFLGVVVKAEKSKLRRDIILDSVPNIVKAAFRDACEKKLAGLLTDKVIDETILPAFKKHGLSQDQIEKIIAKPRSLGWDEADKIELRQILTALKNEETTVAELLADLDDDNKQPSTSSSTGPVQGSDFTNPKQSESSTPKTEPQKTEPPKSETNTSEKSEGAAASDETEPPADLSAVLADLAKELAAAKDLKTVQDAEDFYLPKVPKDKDIEVIGRCDERREAIRATRGSKSNQKSMPGTT